MIKHILAVVVTVVAVGLMYYVYSVDVSVKSLKRAEDIIQKSQIAVKIEKNRKVNLAKSEDTKSNEADDKVKALAQKAGNIGAFKVSKLYKSKCASCHGINGNGGVGPKIIGFSYEKMIKSLKDFKDGTKQNYVMFGLLQNLNDEQLDTLSKEIAAFASKIQEAK